MLRIKSGPAVIIRSEAGKCNYFFTEQRQVGSNWFCNERARCARAGDVQSVSPHAFNTHIVLPIYFSSLCYSFSLFLKAVLNCIAFFFPLLTLLSVLTGKDSKLSISKDLMLRITLDNWLKGLKHDFPCVSLS